MPPTVSDTINGSRERRAGVSNDGLFSGGRGWSRLRCRKTLDDDSRISRLTDRSERPATEEYLRLREARMREHEKTRADPIRTVEGSDVSLMPVTSPDKRKRTHLLSPVGPLESWVAGAGFEPATFGL